MPAITATDRAGVAWRDAAPVVASASLLLWPAIWNFYPLVFADTGTYLSQAAVGYVGWDRPPFYSLAILPLHLTLTTWPVAVAQALTAAVAVHLLCGLVPSVSRWRATCVVAVLAVCTSLPFYVSQLMPDVFTGLLVLAIALPFASGHAPSFVAVVVTTALIAFHLSHLPLAAALIAALSLALRPGWRFVARATVPVALAALACMTVNVAAHGRASIAPYSDVFLLARLLTEGPAMRTLARDCPQMHWRLCATLAAPPADSDDFLWRSDSPLAQAGGAKAVATEATAIVRRTLSAEPTATASAAFRNALSQLRTFDTGDGLQPWPRTVTPWIDRIFPRAEVARYEQARQQQGTLVVPAWLRGLHAVAALVGIAGCLVAVVRAPRPLAIVAAAALLALPVNATVTGALSHPHDRYQARIVWLPLAVSLAAAPLAVRRRTVVPPGATPAAALAP